jgi:putative ABC transport system permease protein
MSFVANVRYAARTLVRRPGFTATIVLVLGLGIGGTATLFSVVESVLLRPLPYRHPEELVVLWQNNLSQDTPQDPISIPDFYDLKAQQRGLSELTPYRFWRWSMSAPEREPEQVVGGQVSREFLSVLGVNPILGRNFLPEEDRPGGEKAVILDHQFWLSRFGGDPAVLGRLVEMDDVPTRIVGVLPATFVSPTGNHEIVWLPLQADPLSAPRQIRWLRGIGRLGKGVTLERANRELSVVMERLNEQHLDLNKGRGAYVLPLREDLVGSIRSSLLILFGAVTIVLLIAVGNVAGLLLARAVERQREFSLRLALGTSRSRLLGLFATEALVLSMLGGALGFGLAVFAIKALPAYAPANLPRLGEVTLSPLTAVFSFALALLSALVSSLLPSLKASGHEDLQATLRDGGQASTSGASRQRLRRLLVICEIALSVALIVGAGLLAKSYYRLQQVDLGFNPENLLTLDLTLPASRYPSAEPYPKWPTLGQFHQRLLERVRALPGVASVTTAVNHPLKSGFEIPVTFDRQPPPKPGEEDKLVLRPVGADYLRVSGTPLLQGRFFSESDDRSDSPPVVVVNRALAHRFFPHINPVGERLTFFGRSREIVGVISDERFRGAAADVPPAVYPPFLQAPIPWFSVLVRTRVEPRSLVTEVERSIWSIDPKLAIFNVDTVGDLAAKSVARQRFNVLLLGFFAFTALTLALVGIYGQMAHSVAQRQHEIGIRMAIGADRRAILRLILGEGAVALLLGTFGGLALAYGTTRFLSSQLYGIQANDLAVFLGAPCVLIPVGLLACLVPSIRSTKSDPLIVMRSR